MAKETAEEKLLKMLQKSGAPVAAPASKVAAKKKVSFSISIQTINQILLLGIVVCLGLLGLQIRSGVSLLNESVDFTDEVKASVIADNALPSAKNISVYLDKINARNIFKPFDSESTKKAAAPQGLAVKMSKYKLVGVAWLDLPETASVMIEDTATKQTYFLKTGEQIEGVTIKTIYTDRAVFGDENEETTIKL